MKSIFILYMPGHAGHFLTRLFGLSPETIPHIPVDILTNTIGKEPFLPLIKDRVSHYSFKQVPNTHDTWQNFHRAWPDYYRRQAFNYLNDWYDPPFSTVIFCIHPHEFMLQEDIIRDENAEFYCVELADTFKSWVDKEQIKLKFRYRPDYQGELDKFNFIKLKYNMQPINLTDMLTSKGLFLNEYQHIAKLMSLTVNTNSAMRLYDDWISVRGVL